MNRIDRLMATLLLLQGRRCVTAGEIAGHFEISLRTVYRDIAALCEGGVPVVAEAGVGYSLLRGYHVPPVMFTPEEAGALFLGGRLVDHLTDRSLHNQMQSALLKIRAVLPRAHQDHLDRLESATELMIRAPSEGSATGGPAVLTGIQSALAERRVLDLEYRKEGEAAPSRRAVEPLGLLYYGERWHLIAHCRLRRDIRDFRTDRILGLKVCSEVFDGHRDFSLRKHVASWRNTSTMTEVVVAAEPWAADRLRRIWRDGVVDEQASGGRIRMTLLADQGARMAGFLLGFGLALEVVAPEALRRQVVEQAMEVARVHAAPAPAPVEGPKAC